MRHVKVDTQEGKDQASLRECLFLVHLVVGKIVNIGLAGVFELFLLCDSLCRYNFCQTFQTRRLKPWIVG